jgi:large subunit ribosomal protein L22
MGKPQRERTLKENEARAVTRLVRVSPQKLNLLAQLIRGKKVDRALADLTFSNRRSPTLRTITPSTSTRSSSPRPM